MILSHKYFNLKGKTVLERIVFKTPFTANRAMQDEACLLYNVKGYIKMYSALNKKALSKNECVIMKCGQYFTSHPPNVDNQPSEIIAVHFYPDILKLAFENSLPDFFTNSNGKKGLQAINAINVDAVLQNYIQSILYLFENSLLVSDDLILLKVKELILLLLKTNSSQGEKIKIVLSDIFNPTEASFREIVNALCYENLTTEQLAILCNMSLSTFKRRFGETFGENPAKYIRQRKLKKASQLLTNTKDSIASICYEVGFSDTSNFSKIFNKYFGQSPKDYRKLKA